LQDVLDQYAGGAEKRKVIIFTEFVATQMYLQKYLEKELLKSSVYFEVRGQVPLSEENYQAIYSKAQEAAYDHFLEMKAAFEQRLQTEYEKTKYAWQLKMEATERIGIENIKKHRKERLLKEQQKMEDDFAARKVVPRLKALLLVRME
jgi:hypothetical protein